jgi:hypothetical protein
MRDAMREIAARILAVDSRSPCARGIRFGFAASRRAVKKLSEQQIIGQQGVHLLGGRLLSVGLSFQSSGPLDAGVDGFLELRDPSTGEVRAQWITGQLKTQKEGRFAEETDESLSYICRQQDLDYWLGSNVPVVLFVARLSDERIFWKAIHTWFSDADRRRTRKVVFDKNRDELNQAALPGFAATVASFSTPGRIVPSTRNAETLNSNLLNVSFPARAHVAETSLEYSELREALVERYGSPPIDWILHGKRIYSFRDISIPPFRDVIEEGSEDTVDTRQWIDSDGEVTRRLFVQLLNRALGEMVHEPLAFWRDRRYLFWKLGRGKQTMTYSYRSFENQTSRKVVKSYKRDGVRWRDEAVLFPARCLPRELHPDLWRVVPGGRADLPLHVGWLPRIPLRLGPDERHQTARNQSERPRSHRHVDGVPRSPARPAAQGTARLHRAAGPTSAVRCPRRPLAGERGRRGEEANGEGAT